MDRNLCHRCCGGNVHDNTALMGSVETVVDVAEGKTDFHLVMFHMDLTHTIAAPKQTMIKGATAIKVAMLFVLSHIVYFPQILTISSADFSLCE